MYFIYKNSNGSGIGDRLFDLLLVYNYSKYLGCNKLFLNWKINSITGNENTVHSIARKEKTPFRDVDYLLENLKKYIILPEDICFVSNEKISKLSLDDNNNVFTEYMGMRYTLYSFMNKFIKIDDRTDFEKNYFINFKKIKFKNIPDEMIDYFKKNEVVTIHLRRGDKVVSDGGKSNNIDTKDLDNLNNITINSIDNLCNLNYKYFNFVSDEKDVRNKYISLFEDKIICKYFDGDKISQTYYDIYSLVNSKIIVLSQAFSAFSIFSSMIKDGELYYLLDHPKIVEFSNYRNINRFPENISKNIKNYNRSTSVINFDNSKYNFKELVNDCYNKSFDINVKLDEIHKLLDTKLIEDKDKEYFRQLRKIGVNDRKSIFIKLFYKYYDNDDNFKNLYYKFVNEVVKPNYFPNEKYLVVQTTPNIRLHLPNTTTLGKMDTDPNENIIGLHNDSQFNHDESEYNFILPITKMFGTNTIYFEKYPNSKINYDDYLNVELNDNELGSYYFNKCYHYNRINKTGKSRISIDFRIIPFSKYNNSVKLSETYKTKLVIGDYFIKL